MLSQELSITNLRSVKDEKDVKNFIGKIMEAVKTIPQVVIPEEQKQLNIVSIEIFPATKTGVVNVNELGAMNRYTTDLSVEWAGVSTANQNIIKAFLKKVVQLCLVVDPTDITGDAL